MEVSRWAWGLVGLAAVVIAVDLVCTPIPSRPAMLDVMVEAARTGEDVAAVRSRRGIPARAWGRAWLLYGSGTDWPRWIEESLCGGRRR